MKGRSSSEARRPMFRRYLLRRLLHAVFLLAGISVLSFILLELAPGDFLDEARINPQLSASTIAALREQYGLNQSLPQKYFHWLGSVANGSLGVSFSYNLPVSTLLWPRARKTLELTIAALLLSWIIALPLGVWSAGRHRRMVRSNDRVGDLAATGPARPGAGLHRFVYRRPYRMVS